MNEFYMDIKKYIKENYSEYKEMSENDEQNYNTKENKKNIIKKNIIILIYLKKRRFTMEDSEPFNTIENKEKFKVM